jgi:hypothetical protein
VPFSGAHHGGQAGHEPARGANITAALIAATCVIVLIVPVLAWVLG